MEMTGGYILHKTPRPMIHLTVSDTSRVRPVTTQHTCVTCLMTSLRGRHRLHGRDTESGAGHRSVKCMYVAINPGEMRDSVSRPRLMDEPALRLVSPVTRHLYSDDRDAPRRTELGGSSRVHAGRLWTPSNLKRWEILSVWSLCCSFGLSEDAARWLQCHLSRCFIDSKMFRPTVGADLGFEIWIKVNQLQFWGDKHKCVLVCVC